MALMGLQMVTASRQDESAKDQPDVIRELPGDEKEDVLFDTLFGIRTIELNRPKKLHSLNGSMIRKIVPRLQEWAKSDMANVVIIKGSGPKAFCAGGDVAALAQDNLQGEEGQHKSTEYFALEYKLDHLIATYMKPYVAFIDGITMGGGVGLSVHAPFRIATERTVFAMPETTIGFFPDVGASFFLPRMPGGVGTYLALTSEKLKGVNVFYAGVATHYIHSTSLPALERRLAELRFKDYDELPERLQLIDSTIEEFCTGLPHDEPMLIQGELRNAIDRCFGKTNVPEIISALKAEEGETKAWAEKALATLHQRSPTSVYVTLRQMQLGKNWSISETFQREYQIAAKFMAHPDFTEGVHALLIRKDGKPQWKPASLEDIKPGDNVAEPFFNVEGSQRLPLLSNDNYPDYPHARFSIPKEKDIESVVSRGELTPKQVVKYFVQQRRGKQGVKEVVQEVVSRKTKKDANGKAVWISEDAAPEV
jgi:3-hydroxyisobutyryl-CoA hydrolase